MFRFENLLRRVTDRIADSARKRGVRDVRRVTDSDIQRDDGEQLLKRTQHLVDVNIGQWMTSLLRDNNLNATDRDSGSGARLLPGQTADRVTVMCFLPSALWNWSLFVEWMLVAWESNKQFVGA
jgi:hypothetical protein